MNILGLGAPELLLILFVLLLFFGKDRLPGLAKSIGGSLKELKKGFSDGASDSTPSATLNTPTKDDTKSDAQDDTRV